MLCDLFLSHTHVYMKSFFIFQTKNNMKSKFLKINQNLAIMWFEIVEIFIVRATKILSMLINLFIINFINFQKRLFGFLFSRVYPQCATVEINPPGHHA